MSDSPEINPLKVEQDVHCFSHENLLKQTETAAQHLGYYILRFYVDEAGVISKEKASNTAEFYLSPSGGTLRDKDMNIVTYSAKYDKYKGYGKA